MEPKIPYFVEKFLFDNFPEGSFCLVGCQATGLHYPVCGYDFIVLDDKNSNIVSCTIKEKHIIVFPVRENELFGQKSRLLWALTNGIIVRDRRLILGSVLEAVRSQARSILRKAAEATTFSVLTKISRAEDAASRSENLSSGFWLLSASYDCMEAILLRNMIVPSPSHLVSQVRHLLANLQESLTKGLSLELSTQLSVLRRLDALREIDERSSLSQVPIDLVETRVRHLLSNGNIVEAFSYVGYVLVRYLEQKYQDKMESEAAPPTYEMIIPQLITKLKLVRKRAVRDLSLPSNPADIDSVLSALKLKIRQEPMFR